MGRSQPFFLRCIVFYIYDAHLFSLAEIVDPTSGRFYYRNVNDGSTTWEKPAGFDEAKAATVAAAAAAAQASTPEIEAAAQAGSSAAPAMEWEGRSLSF